MALPNQFKQKLFVIGVLMSSASSSLATPILFPDKATGLAAVQNPTTSSILADNTDPQKLWVLPPNNGTARAEPLTSATANMGFCPEMKAIQGYSLRLAAEIDAANEKVNQHMASLEPMRKTKERLELEAAGLAAQNSDVQTIVDLQDRLTAVESRIAQINEQLGACTDVQCDGLTIESRQLRAEKAKINGDIFDVSRRVRNELMVYNRAKAKANKAKEHYEERLKDVDNEIASIERAKNALMSSYRNFATLEGGMSNLEYDSRWDENILKLRQLNPNYQFEPVATSEVQIHSTFIGSNNQATYLASLPAVLDYTVNGQAYVPAVVPTKENMLASFPSKMSATLRLSLVGACPMLNPQDFAISADAQKRTKLGMAVAYKYPAAFKTKVSFSYNLYKFYELIKRSGSSGGLFSSRSWSTTQETKMSDDEFKAHWDESDPDNITSEEDRRKIEKAVKTELIERVLKNMAVPQLGSQVAIGSAPAIPQTGAMVIAQGLSETCGQINYYCAAGTWVLRGLNAIFGGSSSENSFKSTDDHTARENWDRTTVRLKPGITVFVGGSDQ